VGRRAHARTADGVPALAPGVASAKPPSAVPGPPGGADLAPAFPADAVEVGRVLGAWGVRGGIRVKPFSADPQALYSSTRWFLRPADDAPRPGAGAGLPPLLRVRQAREQGDAIVATCAELDDREAALRLAGARIFIARSSFPTPAAGEFYWVDLIGLAVRNREGEPLGTVDGLLETGPHCVLCVAAPADTARAAGGAGAGERLIPFVDAYVDRVDLDARVIEVDWPADF
jgi:16S rRNA processing protein RimM